MSHRDVCVPSNECVLFLNRGSVTSSYARRRRAVAFGYVDRGRAGRSRQLQPGSSAGRARRARALVRCACAARARMVRGAIHGRGRRPRPVAVPTRTPPSTRSRSRAARSHDAAARAAPDVVGDTGRRPLLGRRRWGRRHDGLARGRGYDGLVHLMSAACGCGWGVVGGLGCARRDGAPRASKQPQRTASRAPAVPTHRPETRRGAPRGSQRTAAP